MKFYLTLPYSQTSCGSSAHQEIFVSTAQDCGQVYPSKQEVRFAISPGYCRKYFRCMDSFSIVTSAELAQALS